MKEIPVLERLAVALADERAKKGNCPVQLEGLNLDREPQLYCDHDMVECPYKGAQVAFLENNHLGNISIMGHPACSYECQPKEEQPQ